MREVVFVVFILINTAVDARSLREMQAGLPPCSPKFDSAQAVAKVVKKYDPSFTPTTEFDSAHCTWVIHFSTTGYTNKGKCKRTNGCTVWTDYVARINARGKMRVKRLDRKLYPNYE
jgi:hypothetical protein